MDRYVIGSLWDRINRNGANRNFEFLFQTLDRVNSLSNEAAEVLNYAQQTNADNVEVKNLLDDLILESGTSDAETVQARGSFDLLYKRLESYNKRFEQTDYVELLSKYNAFGSIQLHKINNDWVEVSVFNKTRHITYQFQYNNDEFIIQSRVWAGGFKEQIVPSTGYNIADFTLTGSFVGPSSTLTGYTETVGDSFEYSFNTSDNEGINLRFYKNARGGIWRITVDGVFIKNISTYSASATTTVEFITALEKGGHTIHGEFLGADPDNPPSTSPARGWMLNTNSDFMETGSISIITSKDITIVEPSNKEFAFYIRPQSATNHQFVPFHGDPTAFEASPPVFYDGAKKIDIQSLEYEETILLEDFSLDQHVYGRHPETGTVNILEIWNTAKINKDNGMLSFDGRMTTLEPVEFNNSYVIMHPVRGDNFDRVVTAYGNQYVADSATYGTNIPMEEERDWATSYMYLSSQNKGLAAAVRFNTPRETLRQGGFGKDESGDVMTYINNRNATVKKIYSRLFNSQLVPSGFQIRFSGDFMYVNSNNIFDLYRL